MGSTLRLSATRASMLTKETALPGHLSSNGHTTEEATRSGSSLPSTSNKPHNSPNNPNKSSPRTRFNKCLLTLFPPTLSTRYFQQWTPPKLWLSATIMEHALVTTLVNHLNASWSCRMVPSSLLSSAPSRKDSVSSKTPNKMEEKSYLIVESTPAVGLRLFVPPQVSGKTRHIRSRLSPTALWMFVKERLIMGLQSYSGGNTMTSTRYGWLCLPTRPCPSTNPRAAVEIHFSASTFPTFPAFPSLS